MMRRVWCRCEWLRVDLIGLLFALAACLTFGSSTEAGDETARARSGHDGGVVVAVAGPMSGFHSFRFQQVLSGVSRALRVDTRGIVGRVASFDDGCNGVAAKRIAAEIVSSGASVVIGHPCAVAADAAKAIYEQAGVLFLELGLRRVPSGNVRSDARTDRTGSGFPGGGSHGLSTIQMVRRGELGHGIGARVLLRLADGRPIALLHDKTRYARDVSKGIEGELTAAGAAPPLMLGLDSAQRDYSKVANAIVRAGTGAVHFAGFPAEARILIENLTALEGELTFVGSDSLTVASFIRFAEKRGLAGYGVREKLFPSSSRGVRVGLTIPFGAAARLAFDRSKYGAAVIDFLRMNDLEADAFSAAQIWLEGMARLKSDSGPSIGEIIRSGRLQLAPSGVAVLSDGGWVWQPD